MHLGPRCKIIIQPQRHYSLYLFKLIENDSLIKGTHKVREQSQTVIRGEHTGLLERCIRRFCTGRTYGDLSCNKYISEQFSETKYCVPADGRNVSNNRGKSSSSLQTFTIRIIENAAKHSMSTKHLSKAVIQEVQCFQNFCSYAKQGIGWSNILQQQRVWSKLLFRGFKTNSMPSFVNPLIELQKYVSVPIIPPEEAVFSPTEEEVLHGTRIFTSNRGGSKDAVRFVGSYLNLAEMPESSLPEVAFLGRSNVGKSSLIRSLLGAHPQVSISISKKPGHTKTLNLYCIGSHFTLVDMPGYGFNMPRTFEASVEAYLSSRRRLCRTFLLIDAEVGLTNADNIALGMMRETGIPFVIVLTKIDKASRHVVLKNLFSVVKACKQEAGHTCFSQPFLVSSHSGEGLLLLETFIAYVTGCIQIKEQ